ncbi:hypothetical protein DP107_05225 [Haloglomus irregulare]|jgi:hypothetical protein|uniref:Uncharacterized protein n=1 Tax=Haloglomus irregulare TaxID=2234134 RepID=A0A554NCZ4_9EURY|nr:hypothetical protein [Haloglomus irregulare]TSD15252.1 hypothetical protein DP107_05225 [Haloglomus irregulare]
MGLLDSLREALGMRAEADATRRADPDDLFGMSTAYVTMEADLGYRSTGDAALCFSGVDSTEFTAAVRAIEDILAAGETETGTAFDVRTDGKGYEWVVLHDDDPEDLVTSVHFAADELTERGFGSRLLAAAFAFERADEDGTAYWLYSFRRGAYYPFVPDPGGRKERVERLEFKLESVLDGELEVEPEKEYWYPLWPDRGRHPWE